MKRKVVAVTGGIGSGKSEVCGILRQMGYATVDCDVLARQIADEKEVIAAVERLLGADCLTNGTINRAKVREIVFKDENLLKRYDEIFFGRVRQRLTDEITNANGTVFVEIAVIDAFEFHFDEIWLVECEPNVQIERVTARDNVSAENAMHIMKRQHYPNATWVLHNDGSVEQLREQVISALKRAKIV